MAQVPYCKNKCYKKKSYQNTCYKKMCHLKGHHQKGFLLITVVVILSVLAAMALMLSTSSSLDNALVAKGAEGTDLDYVLESGIAHNLHQLSKNTSCISYADLPSTALGDSSYSTTISPKSGSPVSIVVSGVSASGATRKQTYNGIKLYDKESPHEILQPGTEGKDTQVSFSNNSNNYGATPEIVVNGGATPDHILLEFDLSAIPAGSKITKAELELVLDETDSTDVTAAFTVYPMTMAWTEGTGDSSSSGDGATWNRSDGSTSWSWPSNHNDAYPVATTLVNENFIGKHIWDIRPLVQQWTDGSLANNGMLIVGNDQVINAEFYSSDKPDQRPKLHIHYSCECGVACATPAPPICDADFIPNNEVSTIVPSAFGTDSIRGVSYLPEGAVVNGHTVPVGGAWLTADADSQLLVVARNGTLEAGCGLPDSAAGVAYIVSGQHEEKVAVAFNDRIQYFEESCVEKEQIPTADIDNATPSGITHIGVTASGTYDDYLAITDSGSKMVYLVKQNGASVESLDMDGLASSLSGVAHIPGTDKLLLADSVDGKVHVIDIENFSPPATLAEYSLGDYGVTQPQGITINGTTCDHVVGSEVSDAVVALNKVSDLIAHWKMDETGGLVATDSVGGHHGALINGPVWEPSGKIDGTLFFDGQDDYVEVPHHSDLSLSAATISAWLYNDSNSFNSVYRIFSKEQPGSHDNYWAALTAGVLWVGIGGYPYDFYSVLFDHDSWIHLAVSFDNTAKELIVYVNGAELSRYHLFDPTIANTAPLIIGSNWEGKDWRGYLDDIRIYNRVLSETEINDIFSEAGGGVIPPTPMPDDEGDGGDGGGGSCDGTYRDEFINSLVYSGNDGTLNWGGDWQEINEGDGPSDGDEQVIFDSFSAPSMPNSQLRVRDNDGGGEGVMRALDLSGAATATLSFDYRQDDLDKADDYVSVQMSSTGSFGPWTEIVRFDGPADDLSYQSFNQDITAYSSANSVLRIITSSKLGGLDTVYFDNIEIACSP